MTTHYYFVPIERVDNEGIPSRGPKYIKWRHDSTSIPCPWSMIDYGLIDVAFIAADTDLSQHQQLFDQVDVLSVDPRNGNQRNLDANATQAEIDALAAYLDTSGNFVPMGWATTSDTRRSILRGICGIFLYMQRLTGEAGSSPLDWGITLATTWGELTQQQRDWMMIAAVTLGFSVTEPASTVTMRQILRFFGNEWGSRQIALGALGNL